MSWETPSPCTWAGDGKTKTDGYWLTPSPCTWVGGDEAWILIAPLHAIPVHMGRRFLQSVSLSPAFTPSPCTWVGD
jgi:hypothetical protein